MTHVFTQNTLMSRGAQPSGIPSNKGRSESVAKIFSENTLGECRINILIKKEEREGRLERGKNDHRNPAGNRTRDLSLSGQLLYQLSAGLRWSFFPLSSRHSLSSFFILILRNGYVDCMRYSCNRLSKQTRVSGLIFEVVRVELSMLFNVDLCNQK